MGVRRQTLEEWFLCHQLNSIRRRHFHLPFSLEADVSPVANAYLERGEKVPYTAVLIKALAQTARACPEINRMVFTSWTGRRVVDFDTVRVNVPVIVRNGDVQCLAVITIDDADRLSLSEIQARLREAKTMDVSRLLVGRFLVGKRNHFFNRLRLRLIHGLTFRFPSLYAKRGGGLTVSSLLQHRDADLDLMLHAYGPTAFTLCSSTVREDGPGKHRLRLGIGIDHYALSGDQMVRAVRELSRRLTALAVTA